MEVDPAVLRDLAQQHEDVGDKTVEWAKPPQPWLDEFPTTYGHIADPVHKALVDYYDARQKAGNALAKDHYETAAKLRAAADDFENSELEGGRLIRGFGDEPGFGAPTRTAPSISAGGPISTAPNAPDAHQPEVVGASTADTPQNGAAISAPASSDAPDVPAGVPMAGDNSGSDYAGSAISGPSGPGGGPGGGPSGGGFLPPTGPVPLGGIGSGPGGGPSGPPEQRLRTGEPGYLPPAPTPFVAAVAKAKNEDSGPAYVVGDSIDDDLLVARTLLGAVLAAVDSSVLGLHWAVSVMRGPAGAGVFITSNEGRGWFPAGLYLPREVSTPWSWDEALSGGSGEPGSPWEGLSDPARVLAEFGLAWGPIAGAELSALVSSASIDSTLRQRFANVSMQDMVGPSYDVDLRVFTPDTADRLGLTGSEEALRQVAAVTSEQIRDHCLELATDAHGLVGRGGPETAESHAVRDRILASIQAGHPVPRTWWEDLRDADDLLAATMLPHRVDVGRVEPGELRIDDEVAGLRALVFERRCNELVLLLAGEATRQQLRDAVYAHEQIVKHPQFEAAPAAVSVSAPERSSHPVSGATAPSVVAPNVTAGPPSGAVPPRTSTVTSD